MRTKKQRERERERDGEHCIVSKTNIDSKTKAIRGGYIFPTLMFIPGIWNYITG
jgi:hypothetical protein